MTNIINQIILVSITILRNIYHINKYKIHSSYFINIYKFSYKIIIIKKIYIYN